MTTSDNKKQIDEIRNIIHKNLHPLIKSDYVLLDIPNHRNIGDVLIWQGELDFLKSVKYNMLYSCNEYTYQKGKIPTGSTILLHGGGNFGDVWRNSQEFRNNIVRDFSENNIIIFPQTVHYDSKQLLEIDAALFNDHPSLTICARDNVSFEILKKHFTNCNILLVPDMAFCMDVSAHQKYLETNKILILKRVDKEISEAKINTLDSIASQLEESVPQKNIEIKDWPGFYKKGTFKRYLQAITNMAEVRISKKFIKLPILNKFINDIYGLKPRDNKQRLIDKGIRFINEYDEIYTTRLHGYILSILLGKKVTIIDNVYGKNKNFFETWMNDFKESSIIR